MRFLLCALLLLLLALPVMADDYQPAVYGFGEPVVETTWYRIVPIYWQWGDYYWIEWVVFMTPPEPEEPVFGLGGVR